MIETNFDNCVGPLHCYLVGTERKPCPLTNHKVKKLALCVNTGATVYKLEHR